VSSIVNMSVQKGNYVNDQTSESKTRRGCPHAFRAAERLYFQNPSSEPRVIMFQKGENPAFPEFDKGAMSNAVYYIDHFALWQTLPETENDLKHFMRDIQNSVYLRNFVSPSLKCAAIVLTVKPGYSSAGDVVRLLKDKAREGERECGDSFKVDIVGYMVLNEEMRTNIQDDSIYFVKLSALFIIITFFICFRSVRGVVLPFVTLAISEMWLLGIMVLMGYDLNIVLYLVPIFVVAVGSSSSIHILSHFYQEVEAGVDHVRAAVNSARELFVPIVTAASTTAFGFAALTISNVKGLNVFVLLCVIGLAITTLLSLLFIPSLNVLLPKPAMGLVDHTIAEKKWTRLIHLIIDRRAALIWIFLLMTGASVYGIIRISPQ